LYTFSQITGSGTINVPDQILYVELSTGDNINFEYYIYTTGDPASQVFNNLSTFYIDVYNYGVVIAGNWFPIGFIPLGLIYQNKSAWFFVFITKDVFVGGTGATKIYNPGRPLPSPLTCGNYYLKLVSALYTWYQNGLEL